MTVTDWEKWAKDHHIKIATKEEAEKYQEKKLSQKLFKDYINHFEKTNK